MKNGAGKSNFLSLFRLLGAIAEGSLQLYVQKQGGPDVLLFGGRKRTPQLDIALSFGGKGYGIRLTPTADNRLVFESEENLRKGRVWLGPVVHPRSGGYPEAALLVSLGSVSQPIRLALQNCRLYYFHDTSEAAAVKQPHKSNDNLRLSEARVQRHVSARRDQSHCRVARLVQCSVQGEHEKQEYEWDEGKEA